MGRRVNLRIAVALLFSAVATPAASVAYSGGAGLPSSGPSAQPASVRVTSVAGNGIRLSARSAALTHATLWFKGSAASAGGRRIVIQVRGAQPARPWVTAATTTTSSGGRFAVLWRVTRAGGLAARALVEGTSAVSPSLSLSAYRPSVATLYGPGFYGHHTACGLVLRRHTIGVANRTLPCGTPVSIYYGGRIVVVPVIDRGPYSFASWDLTMATGSELGMQGTSTIGALSAASAR